MPQTGAISISPAPEFDTPTDADADGTYEIEVTITDIVGYTTTRPMTVKVLEVPYGIEFTAVENSPTEESLEVLQQCLLLLLQPL